MKRLFKISPYLVLLIGFALRMYRLGANSLWYDETVSAVLAQSELTELIRHTAGDIHPPLYYLLLHFWGRVAGWSEFALAFMSLWFGVLLIALVFRITREWLSQSITAIVAALFVAISPYNIWYSQEVRMYTLGAVLGFLSVYFLRRMLRQHKIFSRAFFAYVVFTVLGSYTLYYFAFLMVFQYAYVAYRVWRIANRKGASIKPRPYADYRLLITFLFSQLALLLLYLPWLPVVFRQATDPPVPPWREFVALPRVLLESVSALAFGQSVEPNLFGWFALLLFIPIGALLANARNPRYALRGAVSPWFLFGYTFIPLGAISLLSLWKPLYHVRYLFTYSPGFYILAAYALYAMARGMVIWSRERGDAAPKALAALAVLVSVGFFAVTGYALYNFWYDEQYAEDDLRGAVNYIAERWRPGDVILVNAGYAYPALEYYFSQALTRERLTDYRGGETAAPLVLMTGSIGGAPNLGWDDPRSDFYATTAEETRTALDRILANHPRVWMLRIYDTVVDPDGVIRKYFDANATLLDDQVFTGESQTRVQGFLTQPTRELPPGATRIEKTLGDRVEFVGHETGARELARGDFFDVVLYWKLLQDVNANYQVSLQLLDANGEKVAQADETPLSELLPMTRWTVGDLNREPLRLQIPAQLAPGNYRAIVKLYDPRTLQVLGELLDVGRVAVR